MAPLLPIDPQRLRHGHGQALLGRDLADQSAQDDQCRWWHNRALHKVYGVVDGLDVQHPDVGATGSPRVSPGLAYDCHGRQLLLSDAWQVPVPDHDETLVLVIAYDVSGATCGPQPGGWCREERVAGDLVALRWLPLSTVTVRDGVPLAVTDRDVVFAVPRSRPIARPRIGRGATVAGETAWIPWREQLDGRTADLGMQVRIDTSAAGFTAPPRYIAEMAASGWSGISGLMLLSFSHIAAATKDGFTFRLLMPWLYAGQGLRDSRALSAAIRMPAEVPLLVVGQDAAQEIPARLAAAQQQTPDYRSAFLGLSRANDLAVSWIGIQHRSTQDDLPLHSLRRTSQ